jgi:hypothetical protein
MLYRILICVLHCAWAEAGILHSVLIGQELKECPIRAHYVT